MAKGDSFHEYIMQDVLGDIPDITSRRMFGGWGIYKDGVIFAIIADWELFFKVDESNRADYEQLGSRPFTYQLEGRNPTSMSYWLLPEEIQSDKNELSLWIERSVKASKPSRKK